MSQSQTRTVSISRPLAKILRRSDIDVIELFDDCAWSQRPGSRNSLALESYKKRILSSTGIDVCWLRNTGFRLSCFIRSGEWEYEEITPLNSKLRITATVPTAALLNVIDREIYHLIAGLPFFEKETIFEAQQLESRLALRLEPLYYHFPHPTHI